MDCDKCDREAVMHAAYSGAHRCEEHFRRSVERRVRRRIREDGLLGPDATPEEPARWLVGLSGGKDSAVLAAILADTFAADPRVELVALTVHEGIEGYRDESLAACRELVEAFDLRHEVVTYAEEFDLRMDDVAADDPLEMAPCAYCGVFRRDVLSRYAADLEADLLLTGHNLDDEAETALMNVLEGDVAQIAKHFDASLGPIHAGEGTDDATDASDGAGEGTDDVSERPSREDQDAFVPRAKPLRDVPEKEVALYAHLRGLPAHVAECPHAAESFRGKIQDLLLTLEEDHPGTRHSIMAGYEELAALAAETYRGEAGPELGACERCGATTARDVCRKCQLLDAIHA